MSSDHVSVGAFLMGLSFFPLGFGLKELVIREGNQTKGLLFVGIFFVMFLIYVVLEVHRRVKISSGDHSDGVTSSAPKNTWMWMFLGSEVVFFTMLIGLSFALRLNVDPKFGMTGIGAGWLGHNPSLLSEGWSSNGFEPSDLNIILTTLNTFLLIISSFTMVIAVESAKEGNTIKTRNFLLLTALIGSTFLGIQISEYTELIVQEGFTPASGLFGSTFYLQTGFHGAHVLVGILLLLLMAYKAHLGAFNNPENNDVEILGLYWHFVDLVWVVLFTLVYLL